MLPVSGAEQLKISDAHENPAHDLGQRRVFEIGDPGAMIPGQEQIPEPFAAGATFQFFQDGRSVMPMPVLHLLRVERFDRIDVPVHEGRQPRLQLGGPRTVLEIHCPGLSLSGEPDRLSGCAALDGRLALTG